MDAQTHARLSHFQALYAQVERDTVELEAVLKKLPAMRARLDELVAYYSTRWRSDYENVDSFPSNEGTYSILSEDTIYNEITSRMAALREMNRVSAEFIAKE